MRSTYITSRSSNSITRRHLQRTLGKVVRRSLAVRLNDASCRRPPSPPDHMNIQHLPQDNASYDMDVNEENPDTDSQVSDQHSSHGNNSLESVVEHRRDTRRV